jgi:hypothetical protein
MPGSPRLTWINVDRRPALDNPPSDHHTTEEEMTTGNVLYLLLCMAMFVSLAAVLAYQSWQQSLLGPEMLPVPGNATAPGHDAAPAGHAAVANQAAPANDAHHVMSA